MLVKANLMVPEQSGPGLRETSPASRRSNARPKADFGCRVTGKWPIRRIDRKRKFKKMELSWYVVELNEESEKVVDDFAANANVENNNRPITAKLAIVSSSR